MKRLLLITSFLFLLGATATQANTYKNVEWVDLLPKADLEALLNPPAFLADIPDGGAGDIFVDPLANGVAQAIAQSKGEMTPQEQAYYQALQSTNIIEEFDNSDIRIAGFIVPVEYNDDLQISEFFLVPWFGACIHTPPPPPNQIIYVRYPQGLTIDALYDPFWIEGNLQTELVENDLAVSAYTIQAEGIKLYDNYRG